MSPDELAETRCADAPANLVSHGNRRVGLRASPAVTTLRSAINKAAHSEPFAAALTGLGLDLAYLDGPDFATFWEADIKQVEAAVRAIGKVQG